MRQMLISVSDSSAKLSSHLVISTQFGDRCFAYLYVFFSVLNTEGRGGGRGEIFIKEHVLFYYYKMKVKHENIRHYEGRSTSGPMFIRVIPLYGYLNLSVSYFCIYLIARCELFRLN